MKTLEIIKDAVPHARRESALWNTADPQVRFYDLAQQDRRAAAIGISLQRFAITRREEVRAALDLVAASRPAALRVSSNLSNVSGFQEIVAFALERKLVSISDAPTYVAAGGLLSYGPDLTEVLDRTVSYVDRILRGAKPRDLPVEQASKYEMVLNAKTARAIAFNPPQSFMLRVNRTIE